MLVNMQFSLLCYRFQFFFLLQFTIREMCISAKIKQIQYKILVILVSFYFKRIYQILIRYGNIKYYLLKKFHKIIISPFYSWRTIVSWYIYLCRNSYRVIGVRFMVINATFNNISVISQQSALLVGETGVPRENHRPVQVTDKFYQIMLYQVHLAWAGFELTMLLVIGTDCTGSCKSNYHMITTMTTPCIIIENCTYLLIHITGTGTLYMILCLKNKKIQHKK